MMNINIISRLRFPKSPDIIGLYIKWNNTNSDFTFSNQIITVSLGDTISFNTYFNSFYEYFYQKYTILRELYYRLYLNGSFQVRVYREKYCQPRELIETYEFLNCNALEPVQVPIVVPAESAQCGRIYLELTSLRNGSQFKSGDLITNLAKRNEVSLAVITCTYKKEKYVQTTINTILKDELLIDKSLKIFIVDNGRTLTYQELNDEKDLICLIPNKNFGGSGGFTRGLIESYTKNLYSHFLFMDDDISLESEVIYRLISVYEYAQDDLTIAGSMLDLTRPFLLYESGAKYGYRFENSKLVKDPLYVASIKQDLYLQDSNNLNLFAVEEDFDYGGFWFFSFSQNTVSSIGLPMPFFIKVDDMEFGLRIKNYNKTSLITFPSISIWHDPFHLKRIIWDNYYYTRNTLVCNSIHKYHNSLLILKRLTQKFLGKLFLFDYNSSEIILRALEDYNKGSSYLANQDPESLHSEIISKSKYYFNEFITPEEKIYDLNKMNFAVTKKYSILKKFIALVTLNGHLIPQFFLDDKNEALVIDEPSFWLKVFGKTQAIAYNKNLGLYKYKINHRLGIFLFIKWIVTIIKILFLWNTINQDWSESHAKLTSIKFWREYLALDNFVTENNED